MESLSILKPYSAILAFSAPFFGDFSNLKFPAPLEFWPGLADYPFCMKSFAMNPYLIAHDPTKLVYCQTMMPIQLHDIQFRQNQLNFGNKNRPGAQI